MKFAAVLGSAVAVAVGAWQAPASKAPLAVAQGNASRSNATPTANTSDVVSKVPLGAAPVSTAQANASRANATVPVKVSSNVSKVNMTAVHAKPLVKAPKSAAAKPVSLAKKGDVMSQMGIMMATSQQSLAQAEALYDKTVEKEKQKFSQLLTTDAKDLAAKIGSYASSLANTSLKLAQAVNATQAALTAVTAAQGKDVPFSVVCEQAGVSAKVDAAAQQASQMARKHVSKQEDAVRQAILQLEDIDQGLSRKLGDVSSLQDDARAIVQAAGPGAGGVVVQAVSNTTKTAKLGKKPASLAEAEKSMDAARAKAVAEVAAADKRFAADLTKASASFAASAQSIKAELEKAEKEEIQRVHEGKVDPTAPPQHHHRHHRHRLV